jgi:hypothetical protein
MIEREGLLMYFLGGLLGNALFGTNAKLGIF